MSENPPNRSAGNPKALACRSLTISSSNVSNPIPLLRDLIDTLTSQITRGHNAPLLAYASRWPLESLGAEEGARLILIGPERVGVIDVDDTC